MAWSGRNGYLSRSEMEGNAAEIWAFFGSRGWSSNAVAAMLANMQGESGINPGIWENLTAFSGGYGLTQWTPYTKYSQWAGSGWQNNGPLECQRIQYEADNNIQWFRNPYCPIVEPPITFKQFTTSNLDLTTLTRYFEWYYEHSAATTHPERAEYAQSWYTFITGQAPPPDVPTPPDDPNPPVSRLDIPAVLLAVPGITKRLMTGQRANRRK